MIKLKNVFDKLLTIAPGGIYGILSVLIAIIGDSIAIILFPGYSLFLYDVSYLARGAGGLIFNLSLILSGLTAIPFNLYLGRIVSSEKVDEKTKKRAVIISIISCISLSLLGFFPISINHLMVIIIHVLLAILLFVGAAISCLHFGYFFLRNSNFKKTQAYMSFIIAGLIIFYISVRWSFVEWLAVFGIMLWVCFISIFTLIKRF